MAGPVTDYIETNEAIFNAAEEKLLAYPEWNVYKYGRTSVANLFNILVNMPSKKLPAVILAYEGSTYYDGVHRRMATIHAVVVCNVYKDFWEEGVMTWSPLVSKAIELLDQQILVDDGNLVSRVVSDDTLELANPLLVGVDITLELMDH